MHALIRRILRSPLALISGLTIAALMAGCGGGGGNDSTQTGTTEDATPPTVSAPTPGTTADMTPPTISSTTPDDGTTTEVNGTVSIAFSEPMDCNTLSNGGLVLKDASNNITAGSLVCDANVATFTPATELAAGVAYTASVTTEAKDISGNRVATDRTWRFTADRSWRTAESIDSDTTANLLSVMPKVAIDSNGSALAIWSENALVSNHFSPASGWGTETPFGTAFVHGNPDIVVAPGGIAIAVWGQLGPEGMEIWSNRHVSGIGWGAAQRISAGGAILPRVAVDNDGNAIAVWQQGDGARTNIWSNRYTPTAGWTTPEILETDDTGDAESPQIAMDSHGNAHAVWRQSDGAGLFGIWTSHYADEVGWTVPQQLETNNSRGTNEPKIAIDGNGNALAVWVQAGDSVSNIWASRYTVGEGWGSAFLSENDDTGSAHSPQIAFDAMGNALIVWIQQATITRSGPCLVLASVGGGTCVPTTTRISSVWSKRYGAGVGWGTPELVETNDAGNAYAPRVAFDGQGNALAVWEQSNGARTRIWANRYKNGLGWGTASSIQSDSTGDGMRPDVAVTSDGNAVAVWGQSDGTRAVVWANRFH